MTSNIDDLFPMTAIAAKLKDEIDNPPSLRQLHRWTERREVNGFPKEERRLGKHVFYSYTAVKEWVILWRRATENYKNNFAQEK